MEKGFLKKEYEDSFEEELSNLTLMRDYIRKSGREDETFSSLRAIDNLTLIDGGIQIPEIIVMQSTKGKTDLLSKHSKKYKDDEIEEMVQRTGLEREDIVKLMQDGMQLEEIGEAADALPFKEISESAAIREMIRSNIKPEQLTLLQEKGIEVVAMADGSIQVTSLEKLAEVDEKGMVHLDPELEKSLQPFEQVGLLSVSEGLVAEEVEPETQEMGDGIGTSLKIVPLQRKREEKTKEELEKAEIARDLGEKAEDIVSVIRIEDREGGSKLFNDSLTQNARPLIIRLRNNNFKVMEEKDDGTREELQAFEATPVSKQVASLLKDTAHNHDTYIRPGEIKAGKTNPNQERYNLFQIRRAGESQDNDSNQLLFAGFSGETDLSLIENRTSGSMAFADVPMTRIYPRTIYMENNIGTPGPKEVVQGNDKQEEDIPQASTIEYGDIGAKIALLEELKYIESKIVSIENQTGHDERCASQHETHSHFGEEHKHEEHEADTGNMDISDDLSDDSAKLPDLYSRRGELLTKLGISQSDSIEKIEAEEEHIPGSRRRP